MEKKDYGREQRLADVVLPGPKWNGEAKPTERKARWRQIMGRLQNRRNRK